MQRWIIHIDMDAFYAAVEQRDNPELKGKPVIIGGAGNRGVVSTASYEARKFGVRSAMPMVQARRLCPQGIYLFPDHRKYARISAQIHAILDAFSPLVEPLALDEAFLDVSGMELIAADPVAIARQIKRRIRDELGLTASAGVAPNKFLAKLASDLGKPDGLFVIRPGEEQKVLAALPIKRLWGVGDATAAILAQLRIQTIGDLARMNPENLARRLGKAAYELWQLANGIDHRPVIADNDPKSVGKELTFEHDLHYREEMLAHLLALSEKVGWRLRRLGVAGRTITLKVRFGSFRTITRSRTLPEPTCLDDIIYATVREILTQTALPEGVRLLGVTVSHLSAGISQTGLFIAEEQGKKLAVYSAIDKLKERFGESIVRRGGLVKTDTDD
ncbi:MAG: DNA polymerase IV [Negativicutes bacterium]|nr:DNA polymerase IV [Negativicutes bacterium]